MIDVGHPFSKPFADLVDSLVDNLQWGVEQSATQTILYEKNTAAYPLSGAASISRLAPQITGIANGKPAVFNLNEHYRYGSGQLIWQPQPAILDPDKARRWFPDPNTRLTVGYFYRDLPSGITDFNAGSVAGTLVRAVSRELKLLYEQMDEAYRRAFIDYAQGAALDNVVALLGVTRNQALPAQGKVTFFLKKPAKNPVAIPLGTRVADARGRTFKVTSAGVIHSTLEELQTAAGTVVKTSEPISGLVRIRTQGGAVDLQTVPTAPGKVFGEDERTITLAQVPANANLLITYQPRTPKVTVPVVALETGPEGNLGSGSLTVMPTPPRGVDGGVTNEFPLTGGSAAEDDDALRERAKHELERAGNATLNAIRFAVLSIDGVDSVDVRDFSVDETIPLGEVWVRFSTGKSSLVAPLVRDKVEQTRAAGIKAHVFEVSTVLISGKLYVIPEAGGGGSQSYASFKDNVVAQLATLGIGQPVSARKLASQIFQVAGLADVAEIQLRYVRGENAPVDIDNDPFMIDSGEQARADEAAMQVVPVQKITVSTATLTGGSTLNVSLGLADDTDSAIRFRDFDLALVATIRGKPSATPNQPLQQVAQVVGTALFSESDSATAVFPPVNIPNLDALDAASLEIVVQAAAYPGIDGGARALSLV
jgi:uncharacterized phage protein gp47/JayE